MSSPQPLRGEDGSGKFDGKVERARNVAVDDEVVVTTHKLGGSSGGHGIDWDLEGKPLDPEEGRLEAGLMLRMDLYVPLPPMALRLQLQMLHHSHVHTRRRLDRRVVCFHPGNDRVGRKVAILIEGDLCGETALGEHEGLRVLAGARGQRAVELLVHHETNFLLEVMLEDDIHLGLSRVDDLPLVRVAGTPISRILGIRARK